MRWRNTPARYGAVSRVLHWAIALAFVAQIPLGFLTQATADQPALQFQLYQWHKSMGFLVLSLAAIRALWSFANPKPRDAAGPHRAGAMLARTAHAVLLLLTLAVPLTGWAIASTSPLQIPSFAFDLVLVPNLPMDVSDAAEAFWSNIHVWLAYGAGALVVIHASAAVYHAFRPHAGSLHGMLPQRRVQAR